MATHPSHHTPNSTGGSVSGPTPSSGPASSAATGGSLAFSNPSSGKIDQQRKILEELERQKKQLAKGNLGTTPAPNASPAPSHAANSGLHAGGTLSKAMEQGDVPSILTQAQKAAMELANKSSFGYFIPQDSAFGNSILPVVPRLQPK